MGTCANLDLVCTTHARSCNASSIIPAHTSSLGHGTRCLEQHRCSYQPRHLLLCHSIHSRAAKHILPASRYPELVCAMTLERALCVFYVVIRAPNPLEQTHHFPVPVQHHTLSRHAPCRDIDHCQHRHSWNRHGYRPVQPHNGGHLQYDSLATGLFELSWMRLTFVGSGDMLCHANSPDLRTNEACCCHVSPCRLVLSRSWFRHSRCWGVILTLSHHGGMRLQAQ
jgi:hypothetical protein